MSQDCEAQYKCNDVHTPNIACARRADDSKLVLGLVRPQIHQPVPLPSKQFLGRTLLSRPAAQGTAFLDISPK